MKAGENASRTLKNDRVVRRLEKVLTLPAAAGSEKSGEVVLGLDKRWKRERLGVAAFLQDPRTMAIYGGVQKARERTSRTQGPEGRASFSSFTSFWSFFSYLTRTE